MLRMASWALLSPLPDALLDARLAFKAVRKAIMDLGIMSVSKEYRMIEWRVGWIVGPKPI